jgi:hypothetical protein
VRFRRTFSVCALAGWLAAAPDWAGALAGPGAPRADRGEAGVVSSDFDGDGFADLAVGVPLEDGAAPDQGEVDVFYGSGAGLRPGQALFIAPSPDVNQSYFKFGSAVAGGDFNRDGYADVVVGVPGYQVGGFGEAGAVFVIPGSPQGLVPGERIILTAKDAGRPLDNGELFGAVLTTGDFNDDHLADLAVGAPSADVGDVQHAGGVAVFYGNRDLTRLDKNHDYLHLFGAESGEDFGAALAAGDFDGDHNDDLAVGAPLRSFQSKPGAGDVWVYSGRDSGVALTRSRRYVQGGTEHGPQARAFYGAALAAGDFDGDGRCDLAVGIPFFSETHQLRAAGAVEVLYGGKFQLAQGAGDRDFLEEGIHGIPGRLQPEDHFGVALAAANLGRGGDVDLAISVPGQSVEGKDGAGEVVIVYGSAHGLDTHENSLLSQGQDEVRGRPDKQDAFGATLAAADFRGYGRADLAVGVPGEDVVTNAQGDRANNGGAVNAFLCTFAGCRRSDDLLTQKWLHLLPEPGDQFGLALGAKGISD